MLMSHFQCPCCLPAFTGEQAKCMNPNGYGHCIIPNAFVSEDCELMDMPSTSCFYNIIHLQDKLNLVSIAGAAPYWYTGRTYRALAPRRVDFDAYMETHDVDAYVKAYKSKVLDKLNPEDVLYNQLGITATIICYEAPGQFCHRRLVADWLTNATGIEIPELTGLAVEASL